MPMKTPGPPTDPPRPAAFHSPLMWRKEDRCRHFFSPMFDPVPLVCSLYDILTLPKESSTDNEEHPLGGPHGWARNRTRVFVHSAARLTRHSTMAKKKTATCSSNDPLSQMEMPYPLRAYQRDGVTFFVQNDSGLLADEMGLGKTVQTILAIRCLGYANLCCRALVVAPRSLCKNWQREFKTWAPNLLVRIVEGMLATAKPYTTFPSPF